jgi:hypothetical protein
MKMTLKILAFFFAVCASVHAQVEPAATGPRNIPVAGNLHYAFRYSQSDQMSDTYPDMMTVTASGTLNYANHSQRKPFLMDYAGGYNWTISGPAYQTGVFQRMYISQGINWHRWKLALHDDASYLPQSPTIGFSGVPGTGEPIGVINPNPNPSNSQSILTLNTHVIDNVAGGELERGLNFATSLTGGGSSELVRYPNGDGLNTNTETGIAKVKWRLNGRNSFLANYVISDYSYPDFYSINFLTNTTLIGFQHAWSRNFTTTATVGPSWINSADQTVVPSSRDVSVSAAATYQLRFTTASVSYGRGTNGGSGYLVGGEVDTVQGNFMHQFGLNSTVGLTGGYMRTAGLSNNGVTNSKFGEGQFTQQIGRRLIVFASYSGTDQTSTSNLPTNALGQLLQTVSFGVGYSPRETHIRQ